MSMISFHNLTTRRLQKYGDEASSDRKILDKYIDALVGFLSSQNASGAVEEALYILGARHRAAFSHADLAIINEEVNSRVLVPLASYFLSGSTSAREDAVGANEPPSPHVYSQSVTHAFNKLKSRIYADSSSGWLNDIEKFISYNRRFIEKTGDAELFVRSAGALAYAIIKTKHISIDSVGALQMLVLEGLKWEPENNYLWGFWAASYVLSGDYDAAEHLYWEAARRHPENLIGRNMLADFLADHLGRVDDAITVAENTLALDPTNQITKSALAHYLTIKGTYESLIKAVKIVSSSDDYTSYHKSTLLRALNVLYLNFGERLIFRDLASKFPEHDKRAGALSLDLARAHPDNTGAAEEFLRQRIKLFPDEEVAKNILARILAASMQPDRIAQAIDVLRAVHKDNEYTRNQLVQCLLALGDQKSHAEAVSLIEDTIARFGDSHHTRKLKQIVENNDAASLRVIMRLRREKAKQFELSGVDPIRGGVIQSFLPKPPSFVYKWASCKKLRFDIEHGTQASRDDALSRLRHLLSTEPTFAYAQILAERYGVWQAESSVRGSFALAFERALRTRDVAAMEDVASRYPRWALLPTTAMALFGDVSCAEKLIKNFRDISNDNVASLNVLRTAIFSNVPLSIGPENLVNHLTDKTETIVGALHDAAESTMGEFSIAA